LQNLGPPTPGPGLDTPELDTHRQQPIQYSIFWNTSKKKKKNKTKQSHPKHAATCILKQVI